MGRNAAMVLSAVLAVAAVSGANAAPPTPTVDPHLVGAWHTVSIDGDALFFIVHGVEIDFDENGSFTARIRFTDGQTETKKGHYVVHGDQIEFSIPSLKAKETATYSIEGRDLRFHDPSFGVTIEVARGKAQDSSGHDLF